MTEARVVRTSERIALRKLFESFMGQLDGVESIDKLLSQKPESDMRRADYLAMGRKIIVEQKVLTVDPAKSPQAFIDRLCKERGILVYGTHSAQRILDRQPDGKQLYEKMLAGMTKGFEDALANADKQTRDTRTLFDIPDSVGVVLVLNEAAPSLHPDLLVHGVQRLVSKRTQNGFLRYPHNDAFVLVSGTHGEVTPTGGQGMPFTTGMAPMCRDQILVQAFAAMLVKEWGRYVGLPVRESGT